MTANSTRLADLKRKLAARLNQPGFEGNVRALKRAIAEIEQGRANGND